MRISDWSSDVCSSDLAGDHAGGAEDGAHHATADVVADQQRVERHGAAVGGAEDGGDQIEIAEVAREDVGAGAERLCGQADDQRGLDADAVGDQAEQSAATVDRKSTRLNSSQSCAHRMPSFPSI